MSSRPRLRAYNLSTSPRLSSASTARRFARAESWLAISDVARKANSATQFCGSAIVTVPIGGRKKKLKHSTAAAEATVDSTNPPFVAMTRIATR